MHMSMLLLENPCFEWAIILLTQDTKFTSDTSATMQLQKYKHGFYRVHNMLFASRR